MARRLSSRRLLWLLSMLLRQSSTIQSCSPSRPTEPPRLLGLMPYYFPVIVVLYPLPHSAPFFPTPSPSSLLRSIRSISHESTFLTSTPGLLPRTNSSMSTISLSPNRVMRSLRSGVSLIVMPLALRFCTMASRSLRHFRHSSKRYTTVCLLPLYHHHRTSSTFPILIRWAPVMAWSDLTRRVVTNQHFWVATWLGDFCENPRSFRNSRIRDVIA
jgi:hypothetical protein